jgi:hypothetical protein
MNNSSRLWWKAALRPLVLGALPLVVSLPGHAATEPPWYPGINSVGHLIFYNASGQVIRGGLLTDHPFAAYVAASTDDYRAGDDKATVFAYLPIAGEPPDAWSGSEMTVSTNYPVAGPGPLGSGTQPVAAGDPGEWSIGDFATVFPNTQTTGPYAGLYELRMKPSGFNIGIGTKYWNTVISVDTSAGTWSVYYP